MLNFDDSVLTHFDKHGKILGIHECRPIKLLNFRCLPKTFFTLNFENLMIFTIFLREKIYKPNFGCY